MRTRPKGGRSTADRSRRPREARRYADPRPARGSASAPRLGVVEAERVACRSQREPAGLTSGGRRRAGRERSARPARWRWRGPRSATLRAILRAWPPRRAGRLADGGVCLRAGAEDGAKALAAESATPEEQAACVTSQSPRSPSAGARVDDARLGARHRGRRLGAEGAAWFKSAVPRPISLRPWPRSF